MLADFAHLLLQKTLINVIWKISCLQTKKRGGGVKREKKGMRRSSHGGSTNGIITMPNCFETQLLSLNTPRESGGLLVFF